MTQFNSSALLASILAAGGGVACSAQVGEEYTGEVMLELSGNVTLLDENQADGAPALVFASERGLERLPSKLEGAFPSGFRMSVTSPPPASAIAESGFAYGLFAVLPRNVADPIPLTLILSQLFSEATEEQCEEQAGVEVCTRTETTCSTEGQCREQDLSCTTRACTLLDTTGDSTLVGANVFRGDISQFGEQKLVKSSNCVAEAKGACYREYHLCALETDRALKERAWPSGTIESCNVLAERQDAGFLEAKSVFSSSHAVVYVLAGFEAAARSELELPNLRAGYNLIERQEPASVEAWLEQAKCEDAAAWQAHLELGYSNGLPDSNWEDPDSIGEDQEAIDQRAAELSVDCPKAEGLRVVSSTETALDIQLGKPALSGF